MEGKLCGKTCGKPVDEMWINQEVFRYLALSVWMILWPPNKAIVEN